ncbi:MAG: hypothetical protein MK074_04165 [Phycisphaerales bacterium]|nr:hypothetical protein [Phycisphaerales bacterium]
MRVFACLSLCVVLTLPGLGGCSDPAPEGSGTDGSQPTGTAPVAPGTGEGSSVFDDLLQGRPATTDTPDTPQLKIDKPVDPGRLLFLGMEAPISKRWQWQPPRGVAMLASWVVPADASSPSDPAHLSIWAPGRDRATVVANTVPEWSKQFRSGVVPHPPAINHRTIGEMDVTIVELAGEYSGMGGGWHRPDHRQLTAIIDGPKTTTIVRLLGPSATVEANRAAFIRMVDGLRTTPN